MRKVNVIQKSLKMIMAICFLDMGVKVSKCLPFMNLLKSQRTGRKENQEYHEFRNCGHFAS